MLIDVVLSWFPVAILFTGRSSGNVNSLPSFPSLTRIFEAEISYGTHHDLFVCGNFSPFQGSSLSSVRWFGEKFQIAFQPEDWILEGGYEILNLTKSLYGVSTIFYFVPSSMDNFLEIVNLLSSHTSYLNRTSIHGTSRIMYFVTWPKMYSKEEGDLSVAVNEISEAVREDAVWIGQADEIYLLVWEIEAPSGGSSESFGLMDIIEIYGIQSQVPVCQSLSLSAQYEVSCSYIHTSELLRWSFRRSDMFGVVLKAVAQPDAVYVSEVNITVIDGTVTLVSGSSFKLLLDLEMTLNFTHKAVLGTGWVTPGTNGSCVDGVGEQVLNYEADICVSTSTMEYYRAKCVAFMQPTLTEESFTFFRQPSITSARNIFTIPFKNALWYAIFGAWFLLAICGGIIAFRKDANFRNVGTAKLFSRYADAVEEYTWLECVIWAVGVYCQQGWSKSPITGSIRIVFVCGLGLSFVIYNYYTAAFVAAASTPTIPIQSFSDFKRYDFKVFTDPDVPASISSFATDEAESRRILGNSKRYYKGDTDAVQKVMTGDKFALIIGRDGFYSVGFEYYDDKTLCEIELIRGKSGAKLKDAMFIRKGEAYHEVFRYRGIMAIERGLNDRYFKGYNMESQLRCLPYVLLEFELKFLECYTAFAILAVGGAVALFGLVYENCQTSARCVFKRFFMALKSRIPSSALSLPLRRPRTKGKEERMKKKWSWKNSMFLE